jgi:hypothetical protein
MNKILSTGTALLFVLAAVPAFAQTLGATVSASGNVPAAERIATGRSRADQEITRRVTALTDLNTKIQAMVKVSASEKSSIANTMQSEISNLTTLKAKVDADTDLTSLKADIKSITASYRIFVLVIPQGRIEVAADKIQTTADSYTSFAVKLQTRISDAQTAGKDVAAVSASLSDMNAKIADSNVQAQAAISLVATLQPDQGVQATMQSNTAALKSARTKIQGALADLKAARQDAGSVVKALQGMDVSATATTTSSAGTQ